MQASNKSDAAQVYESATRATKVGIKDSFKYLLKPLISKEIVFSTKETINF